ncbi:phosphomannomutase/phosphoglucomutase [Candidatus Woesearchaeota archaeon]|nr:phosphomannomutase/phosphoglucomutase [Candidatus Woesearchaeota archaeon]
MISDKPFKAYDIRGLYPQEVNEELAYKLGRSIVDLFGPKKVVIGNDMRVSSPSLTKELTKGFIEAGCDVVQIGLCTTPLLGFSVVSKKFDFGVMVSASHNPAKYNAFKLIMNGGLQMHIDSGISELKKHIMTNHFSSQIASGNVEKASFLEEYLEHIISCCNDLKGIRAVVDYGNGVGALTSSPAFKKLGIDLTELYPEPDGNFPNHAANPQELGNVEELQQEVKSNKAEIGIFYDGDADRSLIVDEKGDIVAPDMLLAALATEELKKHPDKVYYDLRFSKVLPEIIRELGGTPIMMKVGNPFYKEKLIKEGGIIAGEFSGHIMFKENLCLDDGLFAAVKFMNIMREQNKTVSEIIEPFKKYYGSAEINLEVEDADVTMQKVKEQFPDGKNIDLDGVYIVYEDWWFSLRKSNTEPLVRLRLEANTSDLMEEKKDQLLKIIKSEVI